MAEQSTSSSNPRSKWVKTLVFVVGMLAILVVTTLVSLLDRPPKMPANSDHVVAEKFPNKACMQCHPADEMPNSHPIEYKKFECQRCHVQTAKVLPPELFEKKALNEQAPLHSVNAE